MADPQIFEIASTFAKSYYNQFDTNRQGLAVLYRPESKLSFEGQTFTGQDAIGAKLVSLPFQKVVHDISTLDAQLTVDNGVLIVVCGRLKTDDDPVHNFTQTFYLKQIGESLFVLSDVFRLLLHNS